MRVSYALICVAALFVGMVLAAKAIISLTGFIVGEISIFAILMVMDRINVRKYGMQWPDWVLGASIVWFAVMIGVFFMAFEPYTPEGQGKFNTGWLLTAAALALGWILFVIIVNRGRRGPNNVSGRGPGKD